MDSTYYLNVAMLGIRLELFKPLTVCRSQFDHGVKNVDCVIDHSWTASVQHSKQVWL